MCTQVDKQWKCGHISYFNVKTCPKLFKGCKGTSAKHDIVMDPTDCSDCERIKTLPKPFEAK